MRSGFLSMVKQRRPEFVPDGLHVVAQDELRSGVAIAIKKLIVELEDELARIERLRAVRMHRKLRQGLVGEEVRRVFEFEKAIHRDRPIEFTPEKEDAGVHGLGALLVIPEETVVG